jgi:hypothetical protein
MTTFGLIHMSYKCPHKLTTHFRRAYSFTLPYGDLSKKEEQGFLKTELLFS